MSDYDYPAAHSMDSAWYALDKDGYIAQMDTSENGVLPRIAFQRNDEIELALTQELPCFIEDIASKEPNVFSMNLAALGRTAEQEIPGVPTVRSTAYSTGVISQGYAASSGGEVPLEISVVVKSDGSRRAEFYYMLVETNDYQMLSSLMHKTADSFEEPVKLYCPGHEGQYVYLPWVSLEELSALVELGVVLRGWDKFEVTPARLGLFEYVADETTTMGDRYLLASRPPAALHIDAVPARRREMFTGAVLSDISFAGGEEVWPRRYFRCWGWNAD